MSHEINPVGTVPGVDTANYAGVFRRAVAIIIDGVLVFFGLGFLLAAIFGGKTDGGFQLEGGPAFLLFLLSALYFIVLEGTTGATVGKLLLGIRVRGEDGAPIGMQASLLRNVLRIVDGFFAYLVGAILIWTSDRNQRLGDRVAKTVVVGK